MQATLLIVFRVRLVICLLHWPSFSFHTGTVVLDVLMKKDLTDEDLADELMSLMSAVSKFYHQTLQQA